MIRLLKTEYRYNGWFNIAMLIMIPVTTLLISYFGVTDAYITFIIYGYFISYMSTVYANREKRERLNALLPVPLTGIAVSRVTLITLPFIVSWLLFIASLALVSEHLEGLRLPLLAFTGLYMLGFAVYLLIRDGIKYFNTNIFSRAGLFKSGTMVLLLGLTIFLVVATKSAGGGEIPAHIRLIGALFDVLFSTSGTAGLYIMLTLCYGISIFSYIRRKSYL